MTRYKYLRSRLLGSEVSFMGIWLLVILLLSTAYPAHARTTRDCFGKIQSLRGTHSPPSAFDIAFDQVNLYHVSISCALFIYASQARDVIGEFRYGVLYKDQAHFDRAVRYPITVVTGKRVGGAIHRRKIIVRDYAEWLPLAKSMSKKQITSIADSWLGNVMVVGTTSFNPGFIVDHGLVFFSTSNPQEVKVTMIDLSP